MRTTLAPHGQRIYMHVAVLGRKWSKNIDFPANCLLLAMQRLSRADRGYSHRAVTIDKAKDRCLAQTSKQGPKIRFFLWFSFLMGKTIFTAMKKADKVTAMQVQVEQVVTRGLLDEAAAADIEAAEDAAKRDASNSDGSDGTGRGDEDADELEDDDSDD